MGEFILHVVLGLFASAAGIAILVLVAAAIHLIRLGSPPKQPTTKVEVDYEIASRVINRILPLPSGQEARVKVYYYDSGKSPVFELYEFTGDGQGNSPTLEGAEALANALLRYARELKYPQGITTLQGVQS